MRILLLISSLDAGGAERVACTLAGGWVHRGDQVTLIATFSGRGECFYDLAPGVRLEYLADRVRNRSRSLANKLARLRELRKFIRSERPDVIVSFLSNVNLAAIIASAGLSIPLVVCERTDPFVCPTSRGQKVACRMLYPFADAMMVQTEAVERKYSVSGHSVPRLFVIPNPIPPKMASLTMARVPDVRKRLLTVGRLSEEKQFGLLIRVFSRLTDVHSDWSLRVVGEGPQRNDLQQQIVELGLGSRVELAGHSAEISDEFAHADAFVMTSRFEGFPNALLEAMATGLPCVTFDCPSGPSEISMNGRAAILIGPNDELALERAIGQLMTDAERRLALGTLARRSVLERYSLGRVLAQWDQLFESIGVPH